MLFKQMLLRGVVRVSRVGAVRLARTFVPRATFATGAEFKADLKAGKPKYGIFINGHSQTVAGQLSHSGVFCVIDLFIHSFL